LKKIKDVKRFANALIRSVGIDNTPQTVNELEALNALMLKSTAFKSLLFNPQFTSVEREAVLKQFAQKMKLSDYTIKFVMYLSELGIIPALSAIIRFATNLYFEKKKKAKAVVMTPIEIRKDQEDSLKSSLKKIIDRDVDIEYVMDPSLLGGILVKVGSTMYDTSIKSQLRLLRDDLIKG
jgi:F-type H+-transporting ATPase subunit delta